MQIDKNPYELLVRWGQDGELSGAHVQWRYLIRDDDGMVVGESVSGAEPVDVGSGNGFPLDDILSEAASAALRQFASAKAAAAAE